MNALPSDQKPPGLVIGLLSKLANLFWWLLLAVLVIAALYAGLGRQLTQNIDNYRAEIEQQLSDRLGHDVRIGSLSSRWTWLNPTIIARDLVVRQEAEDEDIVASLQNLRVGLDFLASLMRLRIVFSDFDADGLELVINQSARGEIEVEGVELPEPVANNLSQWINLAGQWLSDPYVRITRVALGLRDGSGQLRQVEIPQLNLMYRRGLFRASGRAMRPGTTEQLASFRLVGQHFFRGDFTGQFFGDINSGRLFDGLMQEYGWKGVRAEGFDIGGQVWLTFQDGLMKQASGTLETPYLQLGNGRESLAPLEQIRARFGWRRDGTENLLPWYATGEFHLNDLTWRWNGETVPGFDLRFQPGPGADAVIADRFPVAPVRGLLSRLGIFPERLVRALDNYRPSGTMNRLLLMLPEDDSGDFRLTADLHNIAVQAHGGAPAAQGLDGSLVVTRAGGLIQADSATLTLGLPQLFQGLWEVRNFTADLAWRFEDDLIRGFSSDIAMDYGPSARLTGAFDLSLGSAGEDQLGLRVSVADGSAGMLAEFVPVNRVSPGLYAWLTTAIRQADIVSGSYFGHGPVGHGSPPGSFVSSMVYDFENLTVEYDPRWPQVTGAEGRVFIHQGRTRVDLDSGQTGGVALSPGQVRVQPGAGGSTMVYINTAAPVSGDALAFWLKRSPLGEMAGTAADDFVFAGNFNLDLALGFALDSDQAPSVEARVRTESGALTLSAADLQWTDISGEVSYSTASGFSRAPVAARFLGSPVAVSFQADRPGGGLGVRQAGTLGLPALWNRLGLAESNSLGAEGSLEYEALVDVQPEKPVTVTLSSDLTGVALAWPAPLGKTAETSSPATVTIEPGNEENGLGFRVRWPQRADFDLRWQPERVDLNIDSLRIGQRQFQGVSVDAVLGVENWLISADAEWIRGMVTWPVSGRAVTVDLERLALVREKDRIDGTEAPLETQDPVQAASGLDFSSWPDVDVRIADLQVNGENAGIWSFALKPVASRLTVENIEGKLKSLTLAGALSWGLENDQETTGFKGALTGQSLEDIRPLFAADIPFRSDATVIELDLGWPGRPDQFVLDKLHGSAKVRFEDGVILEGNSTAQLFRVFNLLNSDTISRRLKLDFSDLYEAGVAFDAISGQASFANGVLALDPELQIVGPSGAFKFSGTTHMAEKTLDMNMVVVLPLTQNLPLAALLLGAGAPIGGALFVLDKVLGDPLSKLASASYHVKGSWSNPDVSLKRIFDGG
jgi:uncharacterized protein YhdP